MHLFIGCTQMGIEMKELWCFCKAARTPFGLFVTVLIPLIKTLT